MGPDADLTSLRIGRAVAGDDDSCAWLIGRFTPALLAQARYRLRGAMGRVCEPDDLVQDVWAITLPRLTDLRARDGRWTPVLLKFLATTLLRRVHHLARRRARDGAADGGTDGGEPLAEWTGVVTRVHRRDAHDAVHDAIAELSEVDREVLVLRGIEQHDNGEVARLLGVPDSTVTRRFQRALERLRAALPDSIFSDLG
jgi:RNA polymerase sigma factor (sigma-70 family)